MPAENTTHTTPLTIGIVSSFYAPHMGGVEQFTQNMARTLASMGHRPIVIACNTENAPDVEAEDNLFEVHRLPAKNLGGRYPLPLNNQDFLRHWNAICEIDFDAIVVNTRFYPLSLLGAQMAAMKGLHPIVIEHGSSYLTVGNPAIDRVIAAYERGISKRLLHCEPLGYGVSSRAATWIAQFGIESWGIIHNAIDAHTFRACASERNFRTELGIPEGASLAVFAGRLIPEKGVWCVADAATRYAALGNLHFVIAGEGPEYEHLKEQTPTNVHLTGRLSREDVSALLQQADFFCFPSAYPEGLPTSLLEAAACGAYLITTNVAGAEEIVTGPDLGCILPDASAKSLTDALDRALATPEATKAAATRCQAHVEGAFSWHASATALLAACEDARTR